MANEDICLIWGNGYEARVGRPTPGSSDMLYEVHHSPRADGNYSITPDARYKLREGWLDAPEKARLTTWLVDQRNMGVRYPLVTEDIIRGIRRKPPLAVHERANRLLRFIAEQTITIGTAYKPGKENLAGYAWSESINGNEIEYLINYLLKAKLLETPIGAFGPPVDSLGVPYEVTVSVEGHSQIDLQGTNTDSSQAFVAMWFHDSTNDAYDKGIEPAIKKAGYKPLRIDRKEHVNKIDDEIIAELRRSRFLVADFSHGHDGARGGVYYEAGFAHGLGLPVIFACSKDSVETLHFDTNHYNHIVWKTPDELREKLKNRILAVIGEGPETNVRP